MGYPVKNPCDQRSIRNCVFPLMKFNQSLKAGWIVTNPVSHQDIWVDKIWMVNYRIIKTNFEISSYHHHNHLVWERTDLMLQQHLRPSNINVDYNRLVYLKTNLTPYRCLSIRYTLFHITSILIYIIFLLWRSP
jgi:hypothetical protein